MEDREKEYERVWILASISWASLIFLRVSSVGLKSISEGTNLAVFSREVCASSWIPILLFVTEPMADLLIDSPLVSTPASLRGWYEGVEGLSVLSDVLELCNKPSNLPGTPLRAAWISFDA